MDNNHWQEQIQLSQETLDWLLEPANPSVRFRTLTELLGRSSDDPEVMEAKAQIPDFKVVKKILALIHEDGNWPWTGSYDSPELGFPHLGEVGLDRSHPLVDRAAQVFLAHQGENGSFPNSYYLQKTGEIRLDDQSCYYALMLRGFLRLGYHDDPRVQKALDYTLTQSRWDGGYLCTKSYVKAGTKTKSCIRGSKNILMLFAELPELWEHPVCQRLLDYFLERKVFFRRGDLTQFTRGHPPVLRFPFYYAVGLVDPIYALSKMGYGNHPAMEDAWRLLADKRDETGRYPLDWTMPKCAFRPGKKGEPNKWITLYAYLSLKQKVTVPEA